MIICAAQTRPVIGNIQANIENHKKFIRRAVSYGTDIIIFPELSLIGYEPKLAKELALDPDDQRLGFFQQISDSSQITICIGIPLKSNSLPLISMLIFQPSKVRQIYSKQFLHPDEEEFFIRGQNSQYFFGKKNIIAPAICYELSVLQHAEKAFKAGAEIYLASVAKSASGVEQASRRLAEIAKTYAMTVVMSNSIGIADGMQCSGKSAAWDNNGKLSGQLDKISEGLLIFNTDTNGIITIML